MQRPNTADGLFHPGNPIIGEKGTTLTTDWLNGVIEAVETIEAGQSSGAKGYDTQANLYLDLAPDDKALTYVGNDPNPLNNGMYRKSGATGTGSWAQSSSDRVLQVENTATYADASGQLVGYYTSDLIFNPTDYAMSGSGLGLEYANNTTGMFETFIRGITFDAIEFYAKAQYDNQVVTLQLYDVSWNPQTKTTPFTLVGETVLATITIPALPNIFAPAGGMQKHKFALSAPVSVSAGHSVILTASCSTSGGLLFRRSSVTSRGAIIYSGAKDGSGFSRAYYSSPFRLYKTEHAAIDTAIADIQANGYDYVRWQDPRGDAEMAGDAEYASATMGGFSLLAAADFVFNTASGFIWSGTITENIEYRVFVQPSNAMFNPSTTTPVASGTILAADFPHAYTAGSPYSLRLPETISVLSGQSLHILFHGVSGGLIKFRRWLYDAGANPARVSFVYSTTAGAAWPVLTINSAVGPGFGQTAWLLTTESQESRYKGADSIPYVNVASGLTAKNVQAAIDEVVSKAQISALPIAIPPFIYSVVGHEINIYNDNTIPFDASDYRYNYTYAPTDGIQQNERWNLIPAAAQNITLTLDVYSKTGESALATAQTTVVSKAASVGAGVNRKCLFIGDSTTANAPTFIAELGILFGAGDVMDLTFIGTQGTVGAYHEGYPGWAISTFMGAGSPFYFSGAFNFSTYMSTHGYAGLNYVFVHLGINDLFSATSDAAVATLAASMLANLETMITSIHAYDAAINIGLMLTIPPSFNQDSFGNNYQSGYTRWRHKRNTVVYNNLMIAQFSGRTVSNKIFLIPTNCNLDTINNMSVAAATPVNSRNSTTVVRQSNGVHPATPGYNQMADSVYAFLKCQES